MIAITQHAYTRAKERLGYRHDTLKRLAAMAYCYGTQLPETKGRLRRYLDSRQAENPGNDIRIYGEVLYIFTRPGAVGEAIRLITVYQLPNDVKPKPRKAKLFIEL